MSNTEMTPNQERLAAWRRRMRADGHYYSMRAHLAQLTRGVDWEARNNDGSIMLRPQGPKGVAWLLPLHSS